ncbi:MAG: OB-fold domain-containing protein [Actinomycetota bacterium]|nr:OB-fold domain-containing protein [Actinomycetota bacterium]
MARTVSGGLPVSFRYTPGVGNTAFLEALRDRGVLLGSRCEHCSVTYLPSRIFCERCLAELAADTECGPGGELASWTVGHVDIDGEPLNEPVSIGLVRCDGADTVLMHRLLGDGPRQVGQRVEVVLRPAGDREASIMDIDGFRLV